MRYAAVLLICIAAAIRSAPGQGTIVLDSPRDDRRARSAVASRGDLGPARDSYDAFVTEVQSFQRSDILRVFGPPLSRKPDAAVLPIFGPRAYSVPGIMIRPSGGFFAVGDSGYVEIQFDGEHSVAAVLYFRADESFVPLRSASDFEARLSWDLRRLEQVRHWWAEHSRSAPRPNT